MFQQGKERKMSAPREHVATAAYHVCCCALEVIRRRSFAGRTDHPNLSMNKLITSFTAKCFFQLGQLRRIRRSLDMTTPSPHWFTHLLLTASTTVSVYWPARQRRRQPSCNEFSTQLRESSQTAASMIED